MKLNNKGFAVSTIMYMILVLAVVLIVLTLAILSSRRIVLSKISDEAISNINKDIYKYENLIEILKEEAMDYASDNELKVATTISVDDLKSSIPDDILEFNNLITKEIIIEPQEEGTSDPYKIYLDGNQI